MTIPLLDIVSPELARTLLAGARRRRFARKEVVFHEGDVGDTVHIVERGHFVIRAFSPHGQAVTLAIVGPGEIFGELALLRVDGRRLATVAALEPSETICLAGAEFRTMRQENPAVADYLLALLAEKLGRYTGRLLEALYVPADRRVLLRLLELGEVYGSEGRIPVTQADLADLAGTSRATVNRVLNEEKRDRTVELTRGGIRVLDEPRLRERIVTPASAG